MIFNIPSQAWGPGGIYRLDLYFIALLGKVIARFLTGYQILMFRSEEVEGALPINSPADNRDSHKLNYIVSARLRVDFVRSIISFR